MKSMRGGVKGVELRQVRMPNLKRGEIGMKLINREPARIFVGVIVGPSIERRKTSERFPQGRP